MYILGISAFYHDSAAALIKDGVILAAAQEERFTRIKHDSSFPTNSIRFCLEFGKILPDEIEAVVFYEKPFLKFERLLETYLAFAPRGFRSFGPSLQTWASEKLFQKKRIVKKLGESLGQEVQWKTKILFSQHHLSHAASAYYPSGFSEAAVLTIDAVGEWSTSSIGVGEQKELQIVEEMRFPHSLGMLYSAFTHYLGFKVNSGEYKVMGLAPYGEPIYYDLIMNHLLTVHGDGSFSLRMKYFDFATGLTMTNKSFHNLFRSDPRKPETNLTQMHMDIASSLQMVTEELVLGMARRAAEITGKKNLCLAGGVALNAVANGKLVESGLFENVWIQPASGDAGGAIGAALASWYLHFSGEQKEVSAGEDLMNGSLLGPEYSNEQVLDELERIGAKYTSLDEDELIAKTASDLKDGMAIGWMQGRMEFGPRALGSRSILADPRSEKMQKQLNLKVKYRESFRPFAPSVLLEKSNKWFDLVEKSPYMVLVARLLPSRIRKMSEMEDELFGIEKLNVPRSEVPAITHVDYSARVQTVDQNSNKLFRRLIEEFDRITGVPMLVNTSFNVRGEPIVCSPTDAFRCFMGTGLDVLVIGNTYMRKIDQKPSLAKSYEGSYDLD